MSVILNYSTSKNIKTHLENRILDPRKSCFGPPWIRKPRLGTANLNRLISRLVHGNGIPMGIPWETSHGMGWDRHKLLWDGNGTDKYVPWTPLLISTEIEAVAWQFNENH